MRIGSREMFFTLNGKRPEACSDLERWGRWMQTSDPHVAKTDIEDCWVSTVFLGIDHGWSRTGAAILFETMAFGPWDTGRDSHGKPYTYRPSICSMRRYSTWEDAEAGHAEIVREVQTYIAESQKTAEEAIKLAALGWRFDTSGKSGT